MKNEKILVVEFEENSLNSLLQTLQTEGFQVVTAKDGHEGLLMFESENPDLVILEPMLLKLHGFDLCRKITKDSNRKTPVIITTGFYKGEHYKSEALDTFGAAAFFEKPIKNEELLTEIHKLLGNGTKESVQESEKIVQEKVADPFDIEESVREMEKSIKGPEEGSQKPEKEPSVAEKKKDKSGVTSKVDEMLQDAFADFGLRFEKKPQEKESGKPQEKKEVKVESAQEAQNKIDDLGLSLDSEESEQSEEETELKTEELIEELIQKEEETEEEEKAETPLAAQEPEEKTEAGDEVVVEQEEAAEEIKEEIVEEIKEEKKVEKTEEIKQAAKEKSAEAGEEEDGKIFEDYFDEQEKVPPKRDRFGFLKKIKESLPIKIGSTAFVVLVAAGATYYFLKPNKPQTTPVQPTMQTTSEVERSNSGSEPQELSSSVLSAQRGDDRNAPTGGPSLEEPVRTADDSSNLEEETIGGVMEPESTSEFMSTTGLSSSQRQVMLPEGAPAPETRKFEVVEVEESDEEQLGQTSVEISSPQLKEAVKNIMQSENTADRIKTGDLLPIESVDVPPVATKKISPKYPPAAFRQGLEQTVVFRALISEFGNVLDVAFVNPTKIAPAFKNVCDEAVRQWRFSPAKKDGVNVKVWKTFSISFKKNKTE